MTARFPTIVLLATCSVISAGCGSGPTWKEKTYTRTAPREPLAEAKEMLTRFVNGYPVGNDDALLVPDIVAELRKVDAEKADLFEKGFDRLRERPSDAAAAAAALLKQL